MNAIAEASRSDLVSFATSPAQSEGFVGGGCPFKAMTRALAKQVQVFSWIKNVVAKPNPQIGRVGAVCPFLPRALKQGSMRFETITVAGRSSDGIDEQIRQFATTFTKMEPTSGKGRLNKALVIIFSDVSAEGAVGEIEERQRRLKPCFVEQGLMLGDFHQLHEAAGLHNDQFRPLRSPVPLLVIRHMIPSDLPFLLRESDSRESRTRFLQSFINRFKDRAPAPVFQQACEALSKLA